jgi:hypothetical protein
VRVTSRWIARRLHHGGDSCQICQFATHNGHPMQASVQVRDPKFAERVVSETRAFLVTYQRSVAY